MSKVDELRSADTLDVLITKLEAFADEFVHLSVTPEQRALADNFRAFVEEIFREILPFAAEVEVHQTTAVERKEFLKEHGHESVDGLLTEILADEAAGKSRDDRSHEKLSLNAMRSDRTEEMTPEKGNDKDIRR